MSGSDQIIAAPPSRQSYEYEVEGMRGLAAVMVLYAHLLAPRNDVDPGFSPSPWWDQFEAGHGAVLFFFVLSGYVIGLNYRRPFSAGDCREYLWRRFVRLVPLCWLAIVISVAVMPGDTIGTIAANFLFLQNPLHYGSVHMPLLAANTNLWSLNYEMLYYLLFAGLWAWRLGIVGPIIAASVLVIIGLIVPGFPAFITNYAAGWMFWLAGYWLSQAAKDGNEPTRWPWPSLLLFALATWKIKPLFFIARRAGITLPIEGWVNLTFIDFIPVCVALVMIASMRRPKFAWLLVYVAASVPVAFMGWRALRGRFLVDELALYDGIVLGGIVLWWFRPSPRVFRLAAPLGAISYGIYIFQRPAQWLIAHHDWLPSGNAVTFALRATVIATLTLLLAWLAERQLQPLIRRRLTGRT